jgi:DNA-binding CsgD family transcriptional regulator
MSNLRSLKQKSSASPFEGIFYGLVDDLSRVERVEQGHELLVDAARKYGVKNVCYAAANIPGVTDAEPLLALTYSNEWQQHYKQQDYVHIDPIVRQTMSGLLPLDWAHMDRSDPRVKKFFGEAREFDVGQQGLSFSIRGVNREFAVFSVTTDTNDSEWNDLKRIYMRDFQVIAHYMHAMVLRTTGAHKKDYSSVLSPRERECLQWAASGKSTWDTSVILGVSERAIKFHLDQARHKLDCLTKTHAVAKALSLGLVTLM